MSLFPGPDSAEEAAAFFARFVAAGPQRLRWFEDEVAAHAGFRPDRSPQGLDPVTGWVVGNLTSPGVAQEPEWFTAPFRERGWSPYGAALADGLIYYVAAVYEQRLGTSWQLDTDPRSAYFRRPVLGVPVTPPWRVVPALAQISTGERDVSVIRTAVETCLQGSGLSWGTGDALPVHVEAAPGGRRVYEVWLDPDEVEATAGAQVLDALPALLQAIRGVHAVEQQDRASFRVRAPGMSASQLEHQVRTTIVSGAPAD